MMSKKNAGIQCLRSIAALLVLLQHITYYTVTAKGLNYADFLKVDFGVIGVSLFFVISGFVMAGCMKENYSFMFFRVIRIYPSYWLSILLSFVLLHNAFEWHLDLASLFLIPVNNLNNSYKIPYWTLIFEMTFYAITYLMILAGGEKSRTVHMLCFWLLAIFMFNKYYPIVGAVPGKLIIFSINNIYFIIGMLTFLHLENVKKIPAPLMLIGSLILWGMSNSFTSFAFTLISSVAYSLLLVYCIDNLNNKYLTKLGNFSFGIYLLHVPVCCLIIKIILENSPHISLRYLWIFTMLFSFISSTLFGFFEHNFYLLLKRKVSSWLHKRKSNQNHMPLLKSQ